MNKTPFDPSETVSTLTYPALFPNSPAAIKYNTPIPPKENYRALFNRQMPMWIPVPGDRMMFIPRIDPDNIARAIVMEANPLAPEERGGKDRHGIDWVYVPVAGGSMVKPGNPLLDDANDWEKLLKFPDLDSWDWSASIAANKHLFENEDRAVYTWILSGFFERLISVMDFENAAVALIDESQKDAVKALFERLADLYIDMIGRFKKAYNPMFLCLHDDWGSQRAPFFSLDTVMEMIVPALSRVIDAVHAGGMFFDMHSCGKNELLVPAYIEAGCDSWNGQSMNDKDMLYQKYGDKLIMELNPDITFTPETTDAEAVAAAKRFVARYGPTIEGKPFLCASMGAPPAFSETIYEESRKLFYSM